MMMLLLSVMIIAATPLRAMPDTTLYNINSSPEHSALRKDEPVLTATITNEGHQTKIGQLNIQGKTTYNKMLQEESDAQNTLDFSLIQRLEVLDRFYQSKRHYKPGSEKLPFVKLRLTFANGDKQEFMVAQSLIISGIEEKTKMKKAWLLSTITSIDDIEHRASLSLDTPEQESTNTEPTKKESVGTPKAESASAQVGKISSNFVIRLYHQACSLLASSTKLFNTQERV